MTDGKTPLLTMDVWEHAYYLDQKNKRADYIVDFLESLVSWDFVNANFAKVKVGGGGASSVAPAAGGAGTMCAAVCLPLSCSFSSVSLCC